MPVELKVPAAGESISEVQIGEWLKQEGDRVEKDQTVVEIDTDKTVLEVPAPVSGVLKKIVKKEGEPAAVGDVIGFIEESVSGAATEPSTPAKPSAEKASSDGAGTTETRGGDQLVMPAAQRALAEHGLKAGEVAATGPGGRLLKEDVIRHVDQKKEEHAPAAKPQAAPTAPTTAPAGGAPARLEERVPMSTIRRKIAERLVKAQQSMALLTTFNEIDMTAVMELRKEHQEAFRAKYGVKLGFMSFFVKAAVDALRLVPQVNAEIREKDIVYRNYNDIGVALGTGKGLVVPVLRNAERMSFADIEKAINDFVSRAQENKLKIEELEGGTFTISNGGIYGSLLSTPIINPPQSGILGMHSIQERPIALKGQVVIRPMMNVALTYDHRIVDGREAVTFLKRIKETIEAPARMLLEV